MDPNSNNKSASPLGGVVAGTVERYGHVVSDTCLVTNPCLGRQPSACAKHYSQPPKYEATMYGRKSRSDRSTEVLAALQAVALYPIENLQSPSAE